jgi:hypothetical protein
VTPLSAARVVVTGVICELTLALTDEVDGVIAGFVVNVDVVVEGPVPAELVAVTTAVY